MTGDWSSTATPSGAALRNLIVENRDGIVVVDGHGIVLFANLAAARLLRPVGAALAGTEFGYPTVAEDLAEIDIPATGAVAEMRVAPIDWEGKRAHLITLRNVTARHRAARERDLGMALLTEAERVAGLGSWELEIPTGHLRRSPGYLRILGRASEDLAEDPHLSTEVVHPDDRSRWLGALDDARSGESPLEIEYRIVRPDGEVRTVHAVAETVRGADGRPERLRGIVRDLTDERRSERAHRDAVRMLEEISDQAPAVISVRDLEGRLLFANARYQQVTGLDRDLAGPEHDAGRLPDEMVNAVHAGQREAAASGATITREYRLPLPDGTETVWLAVHFPIHDDEGRTRAVGTVSVDATEQRRAAAALRLSEERFRLLAEHSQDVIFLGRLLPEPALEYVSPAAEAVLGLRPEELMDDPGRALEMVHPGDRSRLDAHWRALDERPIALRCHRPDGALTWVELRLAYIAGEQGRITAVEGNVRDITARVNADQERQRLVRRLDEVERLDALGRLAGGVAHDFNNMLAVILGTAEFLSSELSRDDPRRADVERIVQTARRGAALTGQLLAFGHREPSQPEIIDLNDVVATVEDMLRRTIGEDVQFTVRPAPELPAVRMDPSQAEQVVLSLVVNARAAISGGGRIVIETADVTIPEGERPVGRRRAERPGPPAARHRPRPVAVGDVRAGHYTRLTVSDTGHGMSEEAARRAFAPFVTARPGYEGGGLGLATVQDIVQEAGGAVTLDTRAGVGTTIRVYLPAARQDDAAGTGAERAPRGRGERVLVVEDEDPVREVVTGMLDRNGYEVIAARDAAEAMEICADPDTRIDVMLTDLVMPGMPGGRLAERLHATSRLALPVLYMSGYATEHIVPDDADADADVLHKPFDADTVLRRIRAAIDEARSERPDQEGRL